jgi:hypothetical protein
VNSAHLTIEAVLLALIVVRHFTIRKLERVVLDYRAALEAEHAIVIAKRQEERT